MIQIYHNSRCSKSRECLSLLKHSDVEFEVIKYLETPLTFKELDSIIGKLGINPIELIRKKEKIWLKNFKNKTYTNNELIQIMVLNPILIERPIVINGNKAVIVRPSEKTPEIL
ncbi:MAG: arsenate reductase (glutaredoxin) [Flavobacteriaceae bacterium]|nr:arsenate reductase (glutaredoxin) [Flavobacteriaceae bacterium]